MGETMSLDVELLADQIGRAFRGESWHGPSVLEVLAGVSAEDAAAHPIAGAHSIWEIVLHLIAGYTLVLRRLRGEGAHEVRLAGGGTARAADVSIGRTRVTSDAELPLDAHQR
jgi:hypothetical protein